ncbi:MAG: glycerophosphotransferase [Caulobacteraceae bacterium]
MTAQFPRNQFSAPRLRVCFPFIAQAHQTPHALPIAMELAARHRDTEVTLACLTESHLALVRDLAAAYPQASVRYDLLRLPAALRGDRGFKGLQVARKLGALPYNRNYFAGFDAIVTPELTSLLLKRLGVVRPKIIWTHHGAGDRAGGYVKATAKFDFVVMAGRKLEERLLKLGLIRPGYYATGVYAKFDLVRKLAGRRVRLFDNDRPTVLYNPHFAPGLSSWPKVGAEVLDWFAESDDYNLIFAPHLRLFDPATPKRYAAFDAYSALPHMHIDLGSRALIDMTYTSAADIYLGDVSSQVAEFLTRPRPCVFLNPANVTWRDDPSFRFWSLGEVINRPDELGEGLARAIEGHGQLLPLQEAYIEETFEAALEPTAWRGADAIADYLRAEVGLTA